jgi:hypothetical protein
MSNQKPFSVYSTWGLHDELGDSIELTEALVRGALSNMDRLRDVAGLTFDYFQLDAFWFDPELGYRHFKKPNWPLGFEPVCEEIRTRGMVPGLWYSTNGAWLNVDAWSPSRAASGGCYSLVDGPYTEILLGDLLYAAEHWGVRYFKFDFAHFETRAAGADGEEDETRAASTRVFVDICRSLKRAYPDSKIVTYTGFSLGGGNGPISLNEPFGWDTSLFEVVDVAFSGDPQPTDIPQSALVSNLDLFQDYNVWKMHREGIPLTRIEDCGALIAATNTAAYRGRSGFRRTHVGTLARGARRDMFYGDLGLLTDDDAIGMVKTRALFFDAYSRDLETSVIADKGPGLDPWHGFLTGGGTRGLVYLVNPTQLVQRATVKRPTLAAARILFHTGASVPPLQTQPDELSVELLPEQVVVVGLGAYADPSCGLGSEDDAPLVGPGRLLAGAFRKQGSGLVGDFDAIGGDEILEITIRVQDCAPNHYPGGNEYRFGVPTQANSATPTRVPLPISVMAEGESGPAELITVIPDVPIWAGISWTTWRFRVKGQISVRVSQILDPPRRLWCSARAVVLS